MAAQQTAEGNLKRSLTDRTKVQCKLVPFFQNLVPVFQTGLLMAVQ